MWELVCAQLTLGCLDVAVISTRVNHVGMFLRRAEPASTLGAWAGLGSGFFGVFPVFSRGFKFFFLEGRRPPQAKAPHEVCWHISTSFVWHGSVKLDQPHTHFPELAWQTNCVFLLDPLRKQALDPVLTKSNPREDPRKAVESPGV